MPFSQAERDELLAIKGIGSTVVARLEQMGIDDFKTLGKCKSADICAEATAILGSTCWRNSPQARKAIDAAIATAHVKMTQNT